MADTVSPTAVRHAAIVVRIRSLRRSLSERRLRVQLVRLHFNTCPGAPIFIPRSFLLVSSDSAASQLLPQYCPSAIVLQLRNTTVFVVELLSDYNMIYRLCSYLPKTSTAYNTCKAKTNPRLQWLTVLIQWV